jgi:hypothetical protein
VRTSGTEASEARSSRVKVKGHGLWSLIIILLLLLLLLIIIIIIIILLLLLLLLIIIIIILLLLLIIIIIIIIIIILTPLKVRFSGTEASKARSSRLKVVLFWCRMGASSTSKNVTLIVPSFARLLWTEKAETLRKPTQAGNMVCTTKGRIEGHLIVHS